MKSLIVRQLLQVALLFLTTAYSLQARADILMVTNLNDTYPTSTPGSLRDMMEQADSSAHPGPDTIIFQSGLTGTITLSFPLLQYNDLTIIGPGKSNLTISGGDQSFLFFGLNIGLTLSGVTLSHGSGFAFGTAGGFQGYTQLTLSNCDCTDNKAGYGGVFRNIALVIATDCNFSNNTGTYGGVMADGQLTALRCRFVHNSAANGGVYSLIYSNGQLRATDCTFAGNHASGDAAVFYGGGSSFTNCLFTGNSADYRVGLGFDDSPIYMVHCTIADNPTAANTFLLSGQVILINSILWNNGPGTVAGFPFPGADHCDIQGGASANGFVDNGGNINADPLFVNAAAGDYHLQAGSPCINAGLDNALLPGATDLEGSPRIVGSHADLGAYERSVSNQAPAAYDDIVATAKNTSLPIPVLANDTDPDHDPLAIQSTTPASHGQVTINNDGTITYKPTSGYLGADTFTYTITDGHGGTSTATVYVNVALQTSVLVTNASCVGTGSVALYARLVQGTTAGKNNLIAGQPLLFLVNGVAVGTGITDAYGKAYVNYLPVAAGSFPITVQFTGSGTYAPSEGTGTLTVTPSATEITVQPTGGQAGGGTTITGRLARTSTNKGLMGVSVTVSVDGTVVGTVTTGTDGVFTCPYSIPAGATSGAHNITASFAGNALNSPSTGSATLTVAP